MSEVTETISKLKVMESPAGFYLGRSYQMHIIDDQYMDAPYDRQSGYFPTEQKAQAYLDSGLPVFRF